jgi:NADPH:quinone reductase
MSVGLAAPAIAKGSALTVLAATGRADRSELLEAHGVDHVIVDNGHLEDQVKKVSPGGVDKVLELVGSDTDGLLSLREGGWESAPGGGGGWK